MVSLLFSSYLAFPGASSVGSGWVGLGWLVGSLLVGWLFAASPAGWLTGSLTDGVGGHMGALLSGQWFRCHLVFVGAI